VTHGYNRLLSRGPGAWLRRHMLICVTHWLQAGFFLFILSFHLTFESCTHASLDYVDVLVLGTLVNYAEACNIECMHIH